ncbi:MAG: energy-coupling factor transporter transmembrane protein EcfT [Cellulosilyticum sp.]|nr:energy-coupling factor transporter transmembrane protein EcfT [Cellulosilyticum sp.]
MRGVLLQSQEAQRNLLDPRTKILLLIMLAVFVLGGTGGKEMIMFRWIFSSLPFILLLTSGKVLTFILWSLVFILGIYIEKNFISNTVGIINCAAVITSAIITKFAPSIMMATYVVSTTTVSEFVAAMERMHITNKITIPMSVMFRFFPTVGEEAAAINAAMDMRGICLGRGKVLEMLEYRLVPMMTCSVKIGEELSAAALTRGLGAPIKRTNICRIGFKMQDKVIFLFCSLTIVYGLFMRLGVIG